MRVLEPEDYQNIFKNDMEMMAQLATQLPQIEGKENLELAGGRKDDFDPEKF